LVGVRDRPSSDPTEAATTAALAHASLTKWVTGRPVRAIFLKGNKAYLFVFLNELECRCVNVELIKEGALIADDDTTTYAHHVLIEAQKEAQAKGVGLWKKK
jgi:endonuclease YncB( thermonuclease family)